VTPPENSAAVIAAKLTKAQRGWLINAGYVDPNSIRFLKRRGVVDSTSRRLTPLGLSVRAHLLAESVS
jgi:hypothetical protein